MRFVTFTKDGAERAGILLGDAAGPDDVVVDLAHPLMQPALAGRAPRVMDLIHSGLADAAARLHDHGTPEAARLPLRSVRLLAPLPAPRRIFGIAHNYVDALAERGAPHPAEPFLFMKEPWTVIGPGEPVVLPPGIGGCTYESEIAAVIGRRADAVSAQDALAHVCAYGVFNDVSASGLIRREGFGPGKNVATFGPFGPYIATSDEVSDPQALRIGLSIDGVVLQDSTTARMLFTVADLVAHLSQRTALEPGDVIATGTPAGIAALREPPAWIRPGTTMTAWVEGLGALVNPVVAGDASSGNAR
ncbi:fumarylacetoacetate hydrolase family protein [uncultured Methylobacterium sp.]|uniref:fumarylacetoacetate hydrolase family protein n=1 Tax=uncultured Methylobacterium sp. TaxID=157278 RepID=UPI0035CBEC73